MPRGKRATKKAKQREEYLLTQAEELNCQSKEDKWDLEEKKQKLLWNRQGSKRKKSGRFSNWERAEKNIASIVEKAWQMTKSSDTKENNLGQEWDTLLSLAK